MVESGVRIMTQTEIDAYIEAQTVTYASRESSNDRWKNGQLWFLSSWMHVSTDSYARRVLDCACGDGVALNWLCARQFHADGVELCKEKAKAARAHGHCVYSLDMHDLSSLAAEQYDLVYSSHTLEHAYDPARVLQGFRRLLKSQGRLLIVLPFPDSGPLDAHCGKRILGTETDDGGAAVIQFISDQGFQLVRSKRDDVREPEIWLEFTAVGGVG